MTLADLENTGRQPLCTAAQVIVADQEVGGCKISVLTT
jgi:hypothetical protein